jgi:purine-binding chemotaxis protein CheW
MPDTEIHMPDIENPEIYPDNPDIGPENIKQVLHERALEIARKRQTKDVKPAGLQVIEFNLGRERYSAEVGFISEVYQIKEITPVPCTPDFVLGVMNVRGQILSVLDLRELFGFPRAEITDDFRVIVLRNEEMEFGILVEAIVGESHIPFTRIQNAVTGLNGSNHEFIKGVTADRLVILDSEKLLSTPMLLVHDEISDS